MGGEKWQVPLLGHSSDGAAACLVYAFMEGGSLDARLERGGAWAPLSARERLLLLSDVASRELRAASYERQAASDFRREPGASSSLQPLAAALPGCLGDAIPFFAYTRSRSSSLRRT